MARRRWSFRRTTTEKSVRHTVELEHGYWSGRRRIVVDDTVIHETGSHLSDGGSVHGFTVDDLVCQLVIDTPTGMWFRYRLFVGDTLVEHDVDVHLDAAVTAGGSVAVPVQVRREHSNPGALVKADVNELRTWGDWYRRLFRR
jgi:hypothetical protein